MASDELLKNLINSYERSEAETPDAFLADALRNDSRFERLRPEEIVQLKRLFWRWIQTQEYGSP